MARLTDMLDTETATTVETPETEATHLVEALQVLIDMINEGALTAEEVGVLDSTVDFITESVDTETLTERKMSPKALMAARKYRLKNKARLAIIAKKKAACMAKIAGKTDTMACGSNGRPHKIDRARAKAARMGAKSR